MLDSILKIYLSLNSREQKSLLLDTKTEPRREGGAEDPISTDLIKKKLLWIINNINLSYA